MEKVLKHVLLLALKFYIFLNVVMFSSFIQIEEITIGTSLTGWVLIQSSQHLSYSLSMEALNISFWDNF